MRWGPQADLPPAPPGCQPGDVDDSRDDLAVAAERHESEKWDLKKDALGEKEVAVAVMDHYDKAAKESRQGRRTSIRRMSIYSPEAAAFLPR